MRQLRVKMPEVNRACRREDVWKGSGTLTRGYSRPSQVRHPQRYYTVQLRRRQWLLFAGSVPISVETSKRHSERSEESRRASKETLRYRSE